MTTRSFLQMSSSPGGKHAHHSFCINDNLKHQFGHQPSLVLATFTLSLACLVLHLNFLTRLARRIHRGSGTRLLPGLPLAELGLGTTCSWDKRRNQLTNLNISQEDRPHLQNGRPCFCEANTRKPSALSCVSPHEGQGGGGGARQRSDS